MSFLSYGLLKTSSSSFFKHPARARITRSYKNNNFKNIFRIFRAARSKTKKYNNLRTCQSCPKTSRLSKNLFSVKNLLKILINFWKNICKTMLFIASFKELDALCYLGPRKGLHDLMAHAQQFYHSIMCPRILLQLVSKKNMAEACPVHG